MGYDKASSLGETRGLRGELERREREFRTLADNVPAMFSYVDREQRYRYVNRAYERTLQRPAHEIVGKTVSEILGPQGFALARPHVEAVLVGQEVVYEADFEFADGPRSMHIHYVPDRGDTDEIRGFFALITDVTELKQAEETLRASEQRLRLALQEAGGGAWDWDLVHDQAWWSAEMYDLWGVEPGTACGKPLRKRWRREACIVSSSASTIRRGANAGWPRTDG
jgi:PAS domain S-box-containing protein